jgi:hypothetical protein
MSIQKIEMMLNIAKSFGFDIFEKIEEFLPKLVAEALALEHRMNCKLMASISLSDDGTHFVLAAYQVQADGTSTAIGAYALNDVPALLEKVKSSFANPSPEENAVTTDVTPQQIAITGGDQLAARAELSSTDGNVWDSKSQSAPTDGTGSGASDAAAGTEQQQ